MICANHLRHVCTVLKAALDFNVTSIQSTSETHEIFNTSLRGETQIVILCVITSKLTTQQSSNISFSYPVWLNITTEDFKPIH